ncbi:MAG: hypothetical protein AB8B55_06645 [Mariniblastus sp.]
MSSRILSPQALLWILTIFTFGSAASPLPNSTAFAQDKDAAEKAKKMEKINVLGPEAAQEFSQGNYAKALSNAKEICKLQPDDVRFQSFLGEVSFASGDFATCVTAYDNVIRLDAKSEPYLWQRGLALYYADRFKEGVEQFETHQTVNSNDVENAVWHLLCAAQISDVAAARKKLIPIVGDTRIPMSQVYEMFAGRMTPKEVLARAMKTSARAREGGRGHKLQQYYAHLYIGLYHEMLGEKDAAMTALKKAKEINPLGKTNFMGQVARVHIDIREQQAKKDAEPDNKETVEEKAGKN